jgi:hypothetical protein
MIASPQLKIDFTGEKERPLVNYRPNDAGFAWRFCNATLLH